MLSEVHAQQDRLALHLCALLGVDPDHVEYDSISLVPWGNDTFHVRMTTVHTMTASEMALIGSTFQSNGVSR